MSERKSWYGDGRQPWDDILEQGWAPAFAAANVLKYLRRTKDPEHSAESARWYYRELVNLSIMEVTLRHGTKHSCLGARWVHQALLDLLTADEKARLQ